MTSSSFARWLIAVAMAFACLTPAAAQVRLHVDPARPVSGDGLSWGTAFKGIRAAVLAAQADPQVEEIWIKAGTYQPGSTPYDVPNGVVMYGGFAGTETQLSQRNPDANVTTLTGQGAHRVLNTSQTDGTAVLDGFTIRDGSTSQSGGACSGGSPVFRRCRFISNHAGGSGGVWDGYAGAVLFIDCRFIDNDANQGGAVASTYEGAMTFVQCRIVANATPQSGILSSYEGSITLLNSVLAGNTAGGNGGAETYSGALTVIGSTVGDNSGSGLVSSALAGPPITVRNSVVSGNSISGSVVASFSCFDGVVAGEGNVTGDPYFANPAGRDFRLGAGAAGIGTGSVELVPPDTYDLDGDGDVSEPWPLDVLGRARIGAGKVAVVDMGAYAYFPDCNVNLVEDADDIAAGFSADLDRNGVPDECEDCNSNAVPDTLDIAAGTSEDCQADGVPDECQQSIQIVKYKLDDGSIENEVGLVQASNFAWFNQFEVAEGGEVLRELRIAWGSGFTAGNIVTVCVWSDPDQDGHPADARVLFRDDLVSVQSPGTGTLQLVTVPGISLGPAGTRFFAGAYTVGGAGIAPIDLGTPSGARSWIAAGATSGAFDLNDLVAAPVFGLIDWYGIPGDWIIRCNGWRAIDCNGNGDLDECDILTGVSVDCQGDGVPDECQLAGNDCNANGVPDGCELASGDLTDCQPNGIPDSCELASGASTDLDANGIPDDCEDCDRNGIPDSLDLAAGAADCQPDGILDRCQLADDGPLVYRRDDGTAEIYVSSDAPNMAWIAQYTVQKGGERINGIDVLHAQMPVGFPVDVYLWSDPNGDGNPTDARVLAHVATTIQFPDSNTYERVEVPDVYVGEAGTSFFIGAIVHNFTLWQDFPGAKHNSGATFTSWLVGKNGTIDPNDLSRDADEFLRIDDLGGAFVGVWCLRAVSEGTNDCNQNGVPDDCDIADGTSVDADRDGRPDECYPPACVADLTGDGTVGAADIAVLLSNWGGTGVGDLDGDGAVGAADIAALLSAWGACG
jgi:hypothetical protein